MNDIEIMKKYIIDIVGNKNPSLMSIPIRNNDFDILGFRLLDELADLRAKVDEREPLEICEELEHEEIECLNHNIKVKQGFNDNSYNVGIKLYIKMV